MTARKMYKGSTVPTECPKHRTEGECWEYKRLLIEEIRKPQDHWIVPDDEPVAA